MDISNNNIIYDLPVEKIVYINLDSRTDRRTQIERQLQIFPQEKIIRFSAIYDKRGTVGVTKSHIGVLKMAIKNNWNNCLIFEDDSIIRDISGFNLLNKLTAQNFDVITLTISYPRYNKLNYRLQQGYTAGAYIVHKNYYKKLLQHYEAGLELLIQTNDKQYFLDQYWNRLFADDLWYSVIPSIFIQSNGYSDIDKRNKVFHDKFFK